MIEKEKEKEEEDEQQQQNEYNWVYEESPLIIFKHYYSRWHIYNQSLTIDTKNILNI